MWLRTLFAGLFSSQPFTADEISAVEGEITFADAIGKHLAWKAQLQESLAGKTSLAVAVDDICRDDRCELGIWLHGAGQQRYGEFKSFDELIAKHAQFHRVACEIVRRGAQGRSQEVQRTLEHELTVASFEVVLRLRKFAGIFDRRP